MCLNINYTEVTTPRNSAAELRRPVVEIQHTTKKFIKHPSYIFLHGNL